MGATETGRVAESRSHDEGGGQRGRWEEVYEVRESEIRRRERAVYQLAESSLPDWLPSPCLFFPVHRFVLFYSRASNTRTRAQVDTGVAVSSRVTSSIDKSTQVSSGSLAKPTPFALQVYDNLHQYQRSWCPLFFSLRGVLIVFAMHEQGSIENY